MGIFVLIAFQLAIAAPFYSNSTALALGFKKGAESTLMRYIEFSKILGGKKGEEHGASFGNTLYWQFVGSKIYYQEDFLLLLKACIAGVNVWYFFIRQNCFIQCLYQLGNTFKNKK